MSRESDVRELCEKVIDITLHFYDDPNGGYVYTCPVCHVSTEVSGRGEQPSMHSFKHDPRCGYLIAKDLLT